MFIMIIKVFEINPKLSLILQSIKSQGDIN
jgi:hypothetical protein